MYIFFHSPENYVMNRSYNPNVYWYESDLMDYLNEFCVNCSDYDIVNIRPMIVSEEQTKSGIFKEEIKQDKGIVDASFIIDYDGYDKGDSRTRIRLETDIVRKTINYLGKKNKRDYSEILSKINVFESDYISSFHHAETGNYSAIGFPNKSAFSYELSSSSGLCMKNAKFPVLLTHLWSLMFGYLDYVCLSDGECILKITGKYKRFRCSCTDLFGRKMTINSRIPINDKMIYGYFDVIRLVVLLYDEGFKACFNYLDNT